MKPSSGSLHPAVYVANGGRARLRTVEIGRRNDAEVEVVGGLREGVRIAER